MFDLAAPPASAAASCIAALRVGSGKGAATAFPMPVGLARHAAGARRGLASADFAPPSSRCVGNLAGMATDEVLGSNPALLMDAAILERVSRACIPPGSTVEWSGEVDERGDVPGFATAHDPALPVATHESCRAFIHAWVRAEPPVNRSRIWVPVRHGVGG